MSDLKFAVMGTGNSGQCFAADIALKGYSVNLAEVPEFADNLNAIDKKGGIAISGEACSGFARMNMITTDIAKAVKGVDVIFIGGSAHAHEPFSKALAESFEDGSSALATKVMPAINDTTEVILAYEEKYTDESRGNRKLKRDLSALGEALENRFALEDQLIAGLHYSHRRQLG